MGISFKTTKMLWGRAAARCSFPSCRKQLVVEGNHSESALIGEICHIVGKSGNAARGASSLGADARNRYNNLILLCANHHREIDHIENEYPVEKLKQIKIEHEEWVNTLSIYDEDAQKSDEVYAEYIDKWVEGCKIETWSDQTSGILTFGQPSADSKFINTLRQTNSYLYRRIWPGKHIKLELSFENYRVVSQDFCNTFSRYAVQRGDTSQLLTEKFYQIPEWDEKRYHALLREYHWHVDLVSDLCLELTRAANLVCDRIRNSVHSSFLLQQGWLTVQSGPNEDLQWKELIVRYSKDEVDLDQPYQGYSIFLDARTQRDLHYGKGQKPA